MNDITYLPQVFCDIVNDHATLNTVIVGVPDEGGNRQFLRVGTGAVETVGGRAYLGVGIVELDRKRRRVLVELPHEADSGVSRMWVPFDNFRKQDVPT
jgi:hypothetical protein